MCRPMCETIRPLSGHLRKPAGLLEFSDSDDGDSRQLHQRPIDVVASDPFFPIQQHFYPRRRRSGSLTTNAPTNPLDQLESFKLIFDLYSPTLEEVNHLWGTLGGRQYPFVLYVLRMLELKFRAVQSESRVYNGSRHRLRAKEHAGKLTWQNASLPDTRDCSKYA